MNTILQRYAPSVLSFLVLVIGGIQAAVAAGPLNGVTIAQLVVLTITTFTTWLAPLIGERWQGKVKTGLELAGVAITLALPFIATGTITWAEALLVAVAFIKAGAAELGVQIRLDPIVAPNVGSAYVVTNLPESDTTQAVADAVHRTVAADPKLAAMFESAGIVPPSDEPAPAADTDGPDHRADVTPDAYPMADGTESTDSNQRGR